MSLDQAPLQPRWFGLFTRITYLHQGLLLAFFVAALRGRSPGVVIQVGMAHLTGILLSVVILAAMYGVASRKSLRALFWLRLILWIGVVKIFVVQLWLLSLGEIVFASYWRVLLLNELIGIPLALYWSRSVQQSYLASLRG